MAKLGLFPLLVVVVLLMELAFARDPPGSSPAPSPDLASDAADEPPSAHPPAPETGSPAPSPEDPSSPPAPIVYVPSPAPSSRSPSTDPAPEPSDVSYADMKASEGGNEKASSGGKKAGIVVGVLAAACVVGLGGMVYRKRQENIRRARYGYAARELL